MSGYPDVVEFVRDSQNHVWKAISLDKPPRRRYLGYAHEKADLLRVFPIAVIRNTHGDLEPV